MQSDLAIENGLRPLSTPLRRRAARLRRSEIGFLAKQSATLKKTPPSSRSDQNLGGLLNPLTREVFLRATPLMSEKMEFYEC